ncbi:hypothetical protein B0T16DRAFT_174950 [Cercophora newfieldiana]|uniref:Uncharacterized protein n=1 Tax=Cercophora newfieldiana TaxID=92897 RepID=A0AA40CN21_9PEZI|nr:hypothetical protein B0T16DRAFT_174950 [Cercophora newfieldiana]
MLGVRHCCRLRSSSRIRRQGKHTTNPTTASSQSSTTVLITRTLSHTVKQSDMSRKGRKEMRKKEECGALLLQKAREETATTNLVTRAAVSLVVVFSRNRSSIGTRVDGIKGLEVGIVLVLVLVLGVCVFNPLIALPLTTPLPFLPILLFLHRRLGTFPRPTPLPRRRCRRRLLRSRRTLLRRLWRRRSRRTFTLALPTTRRRSSSRLLLFLHYRSSSSSRRGARGPPAAARAGGDGFGIRLLHAAGALGATAGPA